MFYSIHIIPKLNSESDPTVQRICHTIQAVAKVANTSVVPRSEIEGSTLIIAVGGDGTMLEAMRLSAACDATAFGVNLGRVGFLTDLSTIGIQNMSFDAVIAQILSNQLPTYVEERTVLVTDMDHRFLACNEISISPDTSDTALTYHLKIDGISAGVHRANGVMVSTANGSTAYSLSVGGALMMPGIEAMQIAPIAPMTLTSRPIIVSGKSIVTIEPSSRSSDETVRVDGVRLNRYGTPPTSVTIRRHHRNAKVLHLADWNYFDALTSKLGWIKE